MSRDPKNATVILAGEHRAIATIVWNAREVRRIERLAGRILWTIENCETERSVQVEFREWNVSSAAWIGTRRLCHWNGGYLKSKKREVLADVQPIPLCIRSARIHRVSQNGERNLRSWRIRSCTKKDRSSLREQDYINIKIFRDRAYFRISNFITGTHTKATFRDPKLQKFTLSSVYLKNPFPAIQAARVDFIIATCWSY